MKVLLTTLNSKFIHTNLAIRYLHQMIKNLCENEIKEYTINNNIDFILKDIYKGKYDLICFSTYIWNIDDTLKICESLKKVSPSTNILLGGPEVSYDGEKLLKKYNFIDFIIFGEGEITIKDFINSYKNKNFEKVEGLIYRFRDSIIKNSKRELISDLNSIPSPYMNLNKDEYENKIVYYETSRGCPFSCEYCLSSTIKGLRYFNIDRVKKELKKLIEANVKQIKFVDRTFNANKEYAKEIMKFIMENDNNYTNFHFEVTAHLLDDDMLDFLSKVKKGLFQFEIGVQSTNKKTLNEVKRVDDFERLSYVVNKISSFKNIHQHLDLIAGLPFEDYNSFKNSFNMVFNLDIEHLQLGFLKMLKGSPIREKTKKHGFIYKDYAPYEILSNLYISYDEILKIKDIEEILEIYYNSLNFKVSINYIIKNYYEKNPFDFFEIFARYYEKKGYFYTSQGKNSLYKILLDFYKHNISEDIDLFKEILKYDYISLGKTSSTLNFMDKIDEVNFKDKCHKFLQDKNNLQKFLPQYKDTPAKNIIKDVQFEVFKYNVLKLKNDYKLNLKQQKTYILFVYGLDNKTFEKSMSYEIDLGGYDEV